MSEIDRRDFFKLSAGLAVGVAGCGDRPGEANPDAHPGPDGNIADDGSPDAGIDPQALPVAPIEVFPIGVSSGDAGPTSIVLHSRYTAGDAIEVLVWPEGTTSVHAYPTTVGDGGYVHVTVEGLEAGKRYGYTFHELAGAGRRSTIGRFRTALAADAMTPLVIGASACTFSGFSSYGVLEAAGARLDLDLHLLLGDTSYNDGADSIDQYRARWQDSLAKEGYRALRGSTSVVATWDDHEVANNWSPETIDPAHFARARQVFFENLPIRRSTEAPDRIWRRLRWGLTAEIFVLDSRSERLPSTRETSNATYLSRAQMDWLKAGLADSPAVFKVVVNSVPIGNFPASFNLGSILLDPADRWQGYPAAQQELLGFIEQTSIAGVLFLSGDFHLACCGKISDSGIGAQTIEILAGPGKQVANPLASLLGPPQFDFATKEMNYAALHLDPQARTARVVYHGEAEQVHGQHQYVV